MKLTRMGLDLANDVFQVFGVNRQGKQVICKQRKRKQVVVFFAQQAPCEAVGRPNMPFVAVKSVEQQAALSVHRVRQLRVGERTALVNQIRGLLTEYGIVVAKSTARIRRALPEILEDAENGLPDLAREVFAELRDRLVELDRQIGEHDRRIQRLAEHNPAAQRIMQLEGIGPVTATAIVAAVGDGTCFKNGRQFSAWLGLTPRQHSTGGKSRMDGISIRGDVYFRYPADSWRPFGVAADGSA